MNGSESGNGHIMVYLIIIVAVLVILFLIFREVMCWYFKINQRISQQSLIIDLLKDIKTSFNQFNKQIGTQITEMPANKTLDTKENKSNVNTSLEIFKNSDEEARCAICKNVDRITNLIIDPVDGLYRHQKCSAK